MIHGISLNVFKGFATEDELVQYFLKQAYHDSVTVFASKKPRLIRILFCTCESLSRWYKITCSNVWKLWVLFLSLVQLKLFCLFAFCLLAIPVFLYACLFDRCGVYKHQQKRFATVPCRVQDTSKLIVHAENDDGTKSLLVSRTVLLVAELLPVRLYLDSGIVTVAIRRWFLKVVYLIKGFQLLTVDRNSANCIWYKMCVFRGRSNSPNYVVVYTPYFVHLVYWYKCQNLLINSE